MNSNASSGQRLGGRTTLDRPRTVSSRRPMPLVRRGLGGATAKRSVSSRQAEGCRLAPELLHLCPS
jgi:hypothetical protein